MKKGSAQGLRPTLPDDADPAYLALLESVWAEDPLQRPTFTHLLKQLEALSPQSGDLMDNLVSMVMPGEGGNLSENDVSPNFPSTCAAGEVLDQPGGNRG